MITDHKVTHYLKGGTKTEDISGHIVRVSDIPNLYKVIEKLEQKGMNKNDL